MTAALAAGRRSFDWVGVCTLGCNTALGGGTIRAGGVLRDILCNDVPLLFRSELYASVSAVTIRYKWEMPKFVFSDDPR
jgi:uncharacterized membrane protein YeiH